MTIASVGARGATALVSLLTVPVILTYLGKRDYALWAIITSFTSWVALFDFGILNGLVHAVSEAYGKDDTEAAAAYVSTAFWLLACVATVLTSVLVATLRFVPWRSLLGVGDVIPSRTVQLCVLAAGIPVLIGIPLTIVRQLYAGYQRTYVYNVFVIAGAILTLVFVVLAVRSSASLPMLIFAYGSAATAASLANMLYLVRREMPWIAPRPSRFTRSALRRLSASSTPLFVFQIGSLLVNNTQLIVLSHGGALSTVADYALLIRLYTVIASFLQLSTYSFVPAFREAYERGDRTWLRHNFRRMLTLRMAFAVVMAGLLLVAGNRMLSLWLRRVDVSFDWRVWAVLAMLMVAATWQSAFSDLLTILDRVWIQVGFVLMNGVATVLLTLVLAPRYGVLGALIGVGFVTVAILSWLMPIIARPILAPPARHATLSG